MDERAKQVMELLPEVEEISDRDLAHKVVTIWAEVWEASGWKDIRTVPKSQDVPTRKLLPHVRGVTLEALAIADNVAKLHGIPINRDHVIAIALLHDVSKLVESDPSGDGHGKSYLGKMLNHGFYGAFKALEKQLPVEIVNAVLTHTHHGSAKPPATLEGIIVHYADMADSDALLVDSGKKTLLERRWAET